MSCLLSLWQQLPGNLHVRLEKCRNWEPQAAQCDSGQLDYDMLLKWLRKLQFKVGQIEMQSSTAAQFYTV